MSETTPAVGQAMRALTRSEPSAAAGPVEARMVSGSELLASIAASLRAEAAAIGAQARARLDLRVELRAIERQERLLELEGRALGLFRPDPGQGSGLLERDLERVRVLLAESVGDCEHCRGRVVARLRSLAAGDG